jgi:hypothetical protein
VGITESSTGVLMIDKYKPKNRIEFLEMINWMLERKFENVSINLKIDGLEVEYELIDSEINGKHQACFIPYPEFSASL